MVQVPVCRITQLEGSEADVIESLVVDAVSFISIFNELMHWKCRVVRLHNCVRDLSEEHKEKKRVWLKPINTKFLTTQAPSFWKRIKCFPRALHWRNLRAKQSPVILDLCLRKTRSGKSRDYRDEIVFVKLRFQNVLSPLGNDSRRLQIPTVSVRSVFEKLRFRDQSVWTVRITAAEKLSCGFKFLWLGGNASSKVGRVSIEDFTYTLKSGFWSVK